MFSFLLQVLSYVCKASKNKTDKNTFIFIDTPNCMHIYMANITYKPRTTCKSQHVNRTFVCERVKTNRSIKLKYIPQCNATIGREKQNNSSAMYNIGTYK